jgi:hypothetical protein
MGITPDVVTVTISIGRNAQSQDDPGDQRPLDGHHWESFKAQVRTLLTEVVDGTVHVDRARSTGLWAGRVEESATFVANIPQSALATLRAGLRLLAATWGQDAIALTIGQTEFVTN